jgi:hypothetical protein
MNNKQRIQRRRLIATFMVIAYMVPDLLPGFISIAAPQVFVHPGAGVSRLPLQVSQFNAAGFGDLSDAVDLANGNVFVGTDNLSYNSKITSNDENTNSVGGSGWNVTQRLRLAGFAKNLATAPNSFSIGSGDGNMVTYFKHPLTDAELVESNIAHWLARYKGVPNTMFYETNPKIGVQYSRDWIVLRRVGTGDIIAHYYDSRGNRVSFHNDGEYADYAQNLSQQYRGAKYNSDPEGQLAVGSPKTEFTYTDFNISTGFSSSGLLSKTKDEWGRINVYKWNTALKTLDYIYHLVQNEDDPSSSWQRLTVFSYCTTSILNVCPNTPQRLLTRRVEMAYNGRGSQSINIVSRTTNFTYRQNTSAEPVLLRSVSRQVVGGLSWNTTFYDYDAAFQVKEVKTVNGLANTDTIVEPATSYTYGSGSVVTRVNPDLPMSSIEPVSVTTIKPERLNPVDMGSSGLNAIKKASSDLLNEKFNRQSPSLNLPNARVSTLATFIVPQGFATDLYRLELQTTTDLTTNFKTNSRINNTRKTNLLGQMPTTEFRVLSQKLEQHPMTTTLEANKTSSITLGEQNLHPGEVLEIKSNNQYAKFSKLKLIPLMVAAGTAATNVKVLQGDAGDKNRHQGNYFFDGNGQLIQKDIWTYSASDGGTGYYQTWKYDYNAADTQARANVRRTRVQQNNPLRLPHDRNRLQTPAQTLR